MKPMPFAAAAVLVLACTLVPALAQAQSGAVATEISERMSQWSTMTMGYQHRTYDDRRSVISSGTGTLSISRPYRFRLEITEPDIELSISDGEKLWLYDPLLKQVQILRLEDRWETAPLLLLSGGVQDLQKNWIISASGSDRRRQYTLRPKDSEILLKQITVIFRGDLPVRMQVVDQLNQLIQVDFKKIKTDVPLAEDLFIFTPPPGVDILEQE